MNSFFRSCWLASVLTTLLLLGAAALAWRSTEAKLPPTPGLEIFGRNYLSAYGGSASMMHLIYHHGLFGLRERLKKSDIILIGSSHVEFGLSAAQLSQRFSAYSGRPIKVYNAGIGFGEGLGFAKDIMVNNGIKQKCVIMDLFSLAADTIIPYGESLRHGSTYQAYCRVLDVWLKAFSDHCLDPFVPRLTVVNFTHLAFSRSFAYGEIRSWESGDAVSIWNPAVGDLTVLSPAQGPDLPYGYAPNLGVLYDPFVKDTMAQLQFSPVYTVVPFGGFHRAIISPEAQPFVPISDADIFYFDQHMHVTHDSRKIITDRLAQGIESQHLFPELLTPSAHP